MIRALNQAQIALDAGEVPVGCALVDGSGCVIAEGCNRVNALRDATQHAELVMLGTLPTGFPLKDCTLHVTVEPCIMCASALACVGLRKVIYYARNQKFGGCGTVLDVSSHVSSPWTKIDASFVPCDEAIKLMQQFFARANPRTAGLRLCKS
ncbi:putative Cytosine deaminase [Giardia muris]|uniref:Putative Cytosine deaminase n=1 Tax=Giardia muris TaxID=5742 RepID=A0A4Z1TCX7_GIAMU|nr:putative Cytosine deaminase [Giardia muris]|eukprot:TNJ30361.1 putative Cytosine deaminase [Giardia muris]